MSISSAPLHPGFQMPPFPVRRFTVNEYHRMIETGILNEEDQVELLEGWIVPKMARNPPHDSVLDQTQEILRACLPSGWRLRVQSAITTDDSEPEPDLAVVPGSANRYRLRHPQPNEVALVLEVADSTLAHDRLAKGRLYARASLPVYWIVNLVDTRLEVFTDPTGPDPDPRYRQRQDLGLAETVSLTVGGQLLTPVAVADLFA